MDGWNVCNAMHDTDAPGVQLIPYILDLKEELKKKYYQIEADSATGK